MRCHCRRSFFFRLCRSTERAADFRLQINQSHETPHIPVKLHSKQEWPKGSNKAQEAAEKQVFVYLFTKMYPLGSSTSTCMVGKARTSHEKY